MRQQRLLEEDRRPRPQIGVSKDNQPKPGITHDDEDDDDHDFMRCDVESIKQYLNGNSGDFMTPRGKTYCAEYDNAMDEGKQVQAIKCLCFKEVPRVDADLFFKCWWPFDNEGVSLPMGQRDLIFHKWEDCQSHGKPKERGPHFNLFNSEPGEGINHASDRSRSLSLGIGMGAVAGVLVLLLGSTRARRRRTPRQGSGSRKV